MPGPVDGGTRIATRTQTTRAVAWNYITFVGGRAATLVSTVVLSRMLAPADFGLVALGLVFVGWLEHLRDLGTSAAIVQARQVDELTSRVAFTTSLATGAVLTMAIVVSAPTVADFFGEPRLVPVIRVLSVAFLLATAGAVHEALLRKRLEFRRRMVPELSRAVVKGVVAIALAAAGFGVWSLVVGQVVGSLASTVGFIVLAGAGVRLAWDPKIAGRLLRFGIPVTIVGLMGVLLNNLDYLVIGRVLDATALGFYTLAFRLPDMLVRSVCNVVSQVLFPVYAEFQDDLARLRHGYLRSLRLIAAVTLPTAAGLALTAGGAVTVLYGERWDAAAVPMAILACYAGVYSLGFTVGDVIKATGRPGILNWIGIIRLAVMLPLLVWSARFGIVGVAWGLLGTTALYTLGHLALASRLLTIPPRRIGEALAGVVVALAGMVLAVSGVSSIIEGGPRVRLAVQVLTGVAAYGTLIRLVAPDVLAEGRDLFRRRRPRLPSG